MEIILAKKIADMDMNELISLMMKLRMSDNQAFEALSEVIEDF